MEASAFDWVDTTVYEVFYYPERDFIFIGSKQPAFVLIELGFNNEFGIRKETLKEKPFKKFFNTAIKLGNL